MKVSETDATRLRRVFVKYPEIMAVYLFGSRATAQAHSGSDFDLAVVSAQGADARSRRLDILTDLARAGYDNVDLSFLDRANVVLCHEAVRLNQIVYSRAQFEAGAFYSRVTRMYLDFLPYLGVQRCALKERLLHGPT